MVLLNRFKSAREKNTRENPAGFRPGRGWIDNIFGTPPIIQQFQRYNLPLALIFLDYTATFDPVTRQILWKILEINSMPVKRTVKELIQAYYSEPTSLIRIYGKETEKFLVESGVKQGCVLSPILFNYCIDWVLEDALMRHNSAQIG